MVGEMYMHDKNQFLTHYYIKPRLMELARGFVGILKEIPLKTPEGKKINTILLSIEDHFKGVSIRKQEPKHQDIGMIIKAFRLALIHLIEYDGGYRDEIAMFFRYFQRFMLSVSKNEDYNRI